MNENIDLTKILDGCPEGAKFWSPIFEEVKFVEISKIDRYPIVIKTKHEYLAYFSKNGKYLDVYKDAECLLFPSKDQRDWSKFVRFWDKPKMEKFDPKTFKPFDKILVRNEDRMWYIDFFVCFDEQKCVNCISDRWDYCIPYNEDTKHLLCTRDDCADYYKWWEK